MEFMKSETIINLARSFAGESQARNRYTFYAKTARHEGQEYLARILEETAANELAHAEEFFEKMVQNANQPLKNIDLCAGYPYLWGDTVHNLAAAAAGERDEQQIAYPKFAQIAEEEGFTEIAALWKRIAAVEGIHHLVFSEAEQQLRTGSLFQKEQPIIWRCLNCGHSEEAKEPWQVCPICGKPRGWVQGDIQTKRLS